MERLVLQEVAQTFSHNGVLLPEGVRPGQLILTGPPGSGKTTILRQLGGWPEEGYLDISMRGWWHSRMMAHRPRELHMGLPFVGFEKATPVYDVESLDDIEYLELDLFRIPLPPPDAGLFRGNFRSKLVFEFLLPPAAVLFERRMERAKKGTHPVDAALKLRQVEAELSFYSTVALYFHQSGMNVYLRESADGPPKRIRDETSPDDPVGMVRARGKLEKDIYHLHDQLRLRQRIVTRAWSYRGNMDLVDLFVQMMRTTLNVEWCNIFLADRDNLDAWLLNSSGMTGAEFMACGLHPLVMEVIESGEYVVREWATTYGADAPVCGTRQARNALLVPIKGVVGRHVAGVILVMNTKGRRCFEEKDRLLLERVALHLQLAVENVSLRQEMMDFSEILSGRAQRMSGLARGALAVLLASLLFSLGVNMYLLLPPVNFLDLLKMLP